MVITSALHAEGPRFEPGRNLFLFDNAICFVFSFVIKLSMAIYLELYYLYVQPMFRGVVVITSASHAEGPRFEPGRNLFYLRRQSFLYFIL